MHINIYIKEIIDNLLYNTRNSIQHCLMTYTGKGSKKRVNICINVTDLLRCTCETSTTLLINYTPSETFFKKLKKKKAGFCATKLDIHLPIII